MKLLGSVWIILAWISLGFALPFEEATKEETTQQPINYRLDTTVRPSHYDLTLIPYLFKNESEGSEQFTFGGHAEITLKSSEDVKEIVLHAKKLDIKEMPTLRPVKESGSLPTIKVINRTLDEKTDKLTLELESTLVKDEDYVLTFNYVGYMEDDMKGFYRSYYTKANGEKFWIGSTQFQPVHARRAFPCFDEPSFKATFQLTISHDKRFSAFSNTKVVSQGDDLGRTKTVFEKTPRMSTYLVAFLVSDFKETGDENELAVIARADAESQTEYALEVGKKLLKKLSEYLGLSYQSLGIRKMHLAAIPDFSAGAMENWGLLTFRERALLYDANFSNFAYKQSIATIIAHEQAHMWFGDYVTCNWWDVTWLNEGFATFFQYFITNEVYPEWELEKRFVAQQIQSVFVMDSLNNTHPMTNRDTNSPADVARMFDNISYNKGASIIRMIEHMLGKDKFKEALQSYFKDEKIKLGNAQPEDLFRAFKSKWTDQNVDLDDIRRDWTEQVGYPVVTIQLNSDRKSFTVSQKRFVLTNNVSQSDLTYTIPISYVTSKNSTFDNTKPDLYLGRDEKQKTVNLTEEVDWIIGNKLQTGYYRVNYDDNTWEQIHHALESANQSDIHEVNRAQIVDDLFNFGRSGLVGYDRVLHLTSYLRKETNYLPWYAAFNGFKYISDRLSSNDFKLLATHILDLLEAVYKSVGFDEAPNEDRLTTYNRAQILSWACGNGYNDCVNKAKKLFDELKRDNKSVPVNVRSVVYCTALREGSEGDFDFLWEKFKKESVATEQVLILGTLGCPKSKTVVEKFLNYILSPDVRRQDKSSAISAAFINNKENVQIVYQFIKGNVVMFKDALGSYSDVASVLSSVASQFTSEDERNDLQKFYDDNKDKFGDSAKIFENAIKNVDNNIQWAKDNLGKVMDYLKKQYGSATSASVSLVLLTFVSGFLIISNNCLSF